METSLSEQHDISFGLIAAFPCSVLGKGFILSLSIAVNFLLVLDTDFVDTFILVSGHRTSQMPLLMSTNKVGALDWQTLSSTTYADLKVLVD